METCCNNSYQNLFDQGRAKKDLKNYLKKGVKGSSKPLSRFLKNLSLKGASILEIGGGIGALIFESFNAGAEKAVYYDISEAFANTFRSEVQKRGLEDKVESYLGDFTEVGAKADPADLVLLDKVICCYENYEELVNLSSAKAQRWYAITLPRDVWWVRAFHRLGNLLLALRKNPFRSYIHPVSQISAMVQEKGFEQVGLRNRNVWQSILFERKS